MQGRSIKVTKPRGKIVDDVCHLVGSSSRVLSTGFVLSTVRQRKQAVFLSVEREGRDRGRPDRTGLIEVFEVFKSLGSSGEEGTRHLDFFDVRALTSTVSPRLELPASASSKLLEDSLLQTTSKVNRSIEGRGSAREIRSLRCSTRKV